jgi:glycosyltransferase involved in cell wall biosynthesis
MGTPVVSTSAGCAALAAETERDLLMADGEKQLADAVVRVLSDAALAKQLSVSGRRYVETHHSWTASALKLAEVYQEAGSRRPVGDR